MFGSLTTTETERYFARLSDAAQDGDLAAFELDAYDSDEGYCTNYEDTTVSDVHESIETNLFLAECYRKQGADGLARECCRAAVREFERFQEIMEIYAGPVLTTRVQAIAAEIGSNTTFVS